MGSEGTQKDDFIGFDVNSELKVAAQNAARREGRSLSNYMRTLLRRQLDVERKLYGPAPTMQEPHR
jgi:hypothetical protein